MATDKIVGDGRKQAPPNTRPINAAPRCAHVLSMQKAETRTYTRISVATTTVEKPFQRENQVVNGRGLGKTVESGEGLFIRFGLLIGEDTTPLVYVLADSK